MATIRDLSTYTGLSVTTISRILNNDPTMVASEATREKVFEAADELGYVMGAKPNISKSLTIGLAEMLTPAEQLEEPYFSYMKNYVTQQCAEAGHELVPLPQVSRAFTYTSPRKLDGIIAIGFFTPEQVEQLQSISSNVVFLDSSPAEGINDSIIINFELALSIEVKHLVDLGHKKIGYIGPKYMFATEPERGLDPRMMLFKRELDQYGLFDEKYVVDTIMSASFAYSAMNEYLTNCDDLPTAFVTGNEESAIGALRSINEFGLKVPTDISLLSFNDTPKAKLTHPPLTSVSVQMMERAVLALYILSQRCGGPQMGTSLPLKIVVPPTLVVRQSTSSPRDFTPQEDRESA